MYDSNMLRFMNVRCMISMTCMLDVDKNADGHVLDQNMDRISKEIAYVPLSGRIRSKRSSCMQPFFFFF